MFIDKTFSGNLVGSGKGEMLTAVTGTEGSAAYVAVERVSGTLDGRTGSFVLAHRGRMTRGAQEMEITVVPDSGANGFSGINGSMTFRIADGFHHYEFSYSLPEAE